MYWFPSLPIAHSNILCGNPASTAEVMKGPEMKAEKWLNGLGREWQLQVGFNSYKKLLGEFCCTPQRPVEQ